MFFKIIGRHDLLQTDQYPTAFLRNDSWNDYGFNTLFNLVVALNAHDNVDVGGVKVLHREQVSGPTPMPGRSFDELSDDYCSLGQDAGYYEKLKQLGLEVYDELLKSLRDVAYTPVIADSFADLDGFRNSLERSRSFSNAIRDASRIFGRSAPYANGQPYSFQLLSQVGGSQFSITFAFNSVAMLPGRMNAVIGYNGSGKTRLLANLAMVAHAGIRDRKEGEFRSEYGELVDSQSKRFGSVIAVSYSAFDTFKVPGEAAQIPGSDEAEELELFERNGDVFGYVYCGLRRAAVDSVGGRGQLKSIDEVMQDLGKAFRSASEGPRVGPLTEALRAVLNEASFSRLGINVPAINQTDFIDLVDDLSTGHKIVINIVVQLAAHLQEGSLVLLDEPETHLHPPLLATLLRGINILLEHYDSYAIAATHSPVVLQEVPSRYVHIIRRFRYRTSVEKPTEETFGENVGFLTRDVFNLDSSDADYHTVLEGLANLTNEKIIALFGKDLNPQAWSYIDGVREEG